MADEGNEGKLKTSSWKERNDVIKTIKANSPDFGWMHVIIAKRKNDQKTFMRLRRYLNWFGIPNEAYFKYLQKMMRLGAKELGWKVDGSVDGVEIKEIVGGEEVPVDVPPPVGGEIPEEIIAFIKKYPTLTKKLIGAIDFDGLTENELDYLVELIKQLNDKVLSAGKRLKNSFIELLPKLTEDESNIDKLNKLVGTWSLTQVIALTETLKNRLNTIDIFEKMIHNEKTYELKSDSSIHRILERSMWILNEDYWILQSNKSLRTYICDELEKKDNEYALKRPDFVCANQGQKIIIVEIKRPTIPLTKKEIDQVELYLRLIGKYKGSKPNIEAYLIGKSISAEARDVIEYRRGIKLMTYEDLIDDCRHRYDEYLRIIESEKDS